MLSLALLLSMLPLIASANLFVNEERIINGYRAPEDRYPYSVSMRDSRGHFCGGTLIGNDVVLTAAHCIGGGDPTSIAIGSDDRGKGVRYDVKSRLIHPSYSSSRDTYDIALVFLEDSARSMDIALPKLNSDSSFPSVGRKAITMGWGKTDSDGGSLPDDLLAVELDVISNSKCEDAEKGGSSYGGDIYDSMICTQTRGKDACQGDSGGPLIIEGDDPTEDVIIGIVSWGIGCAYMPGVFARVSEGMRWIEEEVCDRSDDPPGGLCGTPEPTPFPTMRPTPQPTNFPTRNPTKFPTRSPTRFPTRSPTRYPTSSPTASPTQSPSTSPTASPSSSPTKNPTLSPSFSPTTAEPTSSPTISPTDMPSISLVPTGSPSGSPTESAEPTGQPSETPSISLQPTGTPSASPSTSAQPSESPSDSSMPSSAPSASPSISANPTLSSAPSISSQPTGTPSASPTTSSQPSESPSVSSMPSGAPSSSPSISVNPTVSQWPTSMPSSQPSGQPSSQPSSQPSGQPSGTPSQSPSTSSSPSEQPSSAPSSVPSYSPSVSALPTITSSPSSSTAPSSKPSEEKQRVIPGTSLLISDASVLIGDRNIESNSSNRSGSRFAMGASLLSGIISAWLVF